MFLRRSLASLARAYKLHVYDFFYFNVRTFGGLPPPPHTKKLATLLLPAFANQKSGQMKMADSVPPPPPHSLHEIAATAATPTHFQGCFYHKQLPMYRGLM